MAITTPFKILYGRDPRALHLFVHRETHIADLEVQLIGHDEMLQLLRANMLKAQSFMKAQVDSNQ